MNGALVTTKTLSTWAFHIFHSMGKHEKNKSTMKIPSMAEFAALGSAVETDPEKREAARQRLYALNGGDENIDAGKLAVRIHSSARAQGIRVSIPAVRRVIEDIMEGDGADTSTLNSSD